MNTPFRPASAAVAAQPVFQSTVFSSPMTIDLQKPSNVVIPSNLDRNRVEAVRNEMRKLTAADLPKYAANVGKGTAAAQDKILQMAKASDIDVLETKFGEIIKIAKGVDVSSLTKPKKGFFASIKNKLFDAREQVIAQYSSAEDQINRVFAAVDGTAKAVASRVPVLEDIHKATQQEYVDLDYLIAAGKLELEARENELEQLKVSAQQDPSNIQLQSNLQEAQFYLQQLAIRVSNDERDQQMAFNTLPQVRLMQSNAMTIGQTFATIQGSVMNNWKKQFSLSLIGNEQLRAAKVQNVVLDMNNELARNNATTLRQTTNEVTKANQRGTYDLETLEHVHNETIGAFQDMFKLAGEGKQQREKITLAVAKMKQDAVTTFASL